MIYHFAEVGSTNDEARKAEYRHGDIIWAEWQHAGRGQRGHSWSSERGENLTFSLLLEPTFLPVAEQFLLSEVVALALVDTLAEEEIEARIKWTNDIYIGERKAVGILIEHNYASSTLSRTIVGVGINVNQQTFDPSLPNPISLAQATGKTFEREALLARFYTHCMRLYGALERGEKEQIQSRYREAMYRLGERHPYRLPDGALFEASIEGVRPSGELLLRHEDGTQRAYLFREVEFVLKN